MLLYCIIVSTCEFFMSSSTTFAWCAVSIRELRDAAPSLGRSRVGPNTIPMLPADIWLMCSCSVTLQVKGNCFFWCVHKAEHNDLNLLLIHLLVLCNNVQIGSHLWRWCMSIAHVLELACGSNMTRALSFCRTFASSSSSDSLASLMRSGYSLNVNNGSGNCRINQSVFWSFPFGRTHQISRTHLPYDQKVIVQYVKFNDFSHFRAPLPFFSVHFLLKWIAKIRSFTCLRYSLSTLAITLGWWSERSTLHSSFSKLWHSFSTLDFTPDNR